MHTPATPTTTSTSSAATFSPCARYRYTLLRAWRSRPRQRIVNFIALNPSTADARNDDPTIRRCIAYARSWGFNALIVTNLFALRSTDPAALKTHPDPIGPGNDEAIQSTARRAALIIACWGNHGSILQRADTIRPTLPQLHCLRRNTTTHQPAHPLYLPKHLTPTPYQHHP
ncbi:MAG: DUF1643 domain-containing protein [Phycisphaerales bacterium]